MQYMEEDQVMRDKRIRDFVNVMTEIAEEEITQDESWGEWLTFDFLAAALHVWQVFNVCVIPDPRVHASRGEMQQVSHGEPRLFLFYQGWC